MTRVFPLPGAGQNEDRSFSGLDGFELLRIEKSAEIHSSFYRNTLGEISRLIDIAAAADRNVIGEQLKRNHFEDRKQEFVGRCNGNEVRRTFLQIRVAFESDRNDDAVARFHFLDVVQNFFVALCEFLESGS